MPCIMAYVTAAMPYNIASKGAPGCFHTSIDMTGRQYCACYRHADMGQSIAHATIGMQREGFREQRDDAQGRQTAAGLGRPTPKQGLTL